MELRGACVYSSTCLERETRVFTRGSLLLQTELLHNCAVAALVVLLKVAKVGTTISNHLKKTTAGMKILLVLLKMSRKLINLAAKNSNLDVGGAGILWVACNILDNRGLYSFRKHYMHLTTP